MLASPRGPGQYETPQYDILDFCLMNPAVSDGILSRDTLQGPRDLTQLISTVFLLESVV